MDEWLVLYAGRTKQGVDRLDFHASQRLLVEALLARSFAIEGSRVIFDPRGYPGDAAT